jgi:hypothetical protein
MQVNQLIKHTHTHTSIHLYTILKSTISLVICTPLNRKLITDRQTDSSHSPMPTLLSSLHHQKGQFRNGTQNKITFIVFVLLFSCSITNYLFVLYKNKITCCSHQSLNRVHLILFWATIFKYASAVILKFFALIFFLIKLQFHTPLL